MELGDVRINNLEEQEQDDFVEIQNLWSNTTSVLRFLKGLKGKELADKITLNYGSVENLCYRLGSSPDNGLNKSPTNIESRRLHLGSNYIHPKPQKNFLFYIVDALNDITLIILTVAAIISLILSFVEASKSKSGNDPSKGLEWIEGVTILAAVILIILVTAFNNWTKERQFRNLKKIVTDQQKFAAIRSGQLLQINISDIVVGDVCQVKYGDCIPADGLIIQSNDLKVDESSMTGESDPLKKGVGIDPLLLSGSHILEGSGRMVVIGVGVNTEYGQIFQSLVGGGKNDKSSADMVQVKSKENGGNGDDEDDVKSVLKKKMDRLSIRIGYFGVVMASLTLVVLVVRYSVEKFVLEGLPWDRSHIQDFAGFVLIAITILVIAIPEGLPLAVLLSLAIAIKRMMKDKNLVRHLDACETMGNATCICSDKTGTLTTNMMTVVTCHIDCDTHKLSDHFNDLPNACKYHLALAIAINTSYTSKIISPNLAKKCSGNKTDCALLGFLLKLGLDYDSIRKQHPEEKFIKVYTFNSARKWMATIVQCAPNREEETSSLKLMVKGASEVILQKCSTMMQNDGQIVELDDDTKKLFVQNVIDVMAASGQRTLCIAFRDFEDQGDRDWDDEAAVVSQLTLLCVVGIEDPVRPEVPMAIAKCRSAGITVRMVTGDNLKTARAIARRCGILDAGDEFDDRVVMDSQLFNSRITSASGTVDQELIDQVWPRLRVLARSSPMDKYNLVKGIMDSKISKDQEIVAVTGDGTNDGPALKKAHVGFAMGIAGTDVAKEASDIILMDDNFTSIVKAVVWGRHVYDSIAKFLQFQLTVNVVAVFIAFISACFVADTPLKAVQMIWINLIQDTLASLSLATEYPTEKLLKRKPYGRNKSIMSTDIIINISIHGLYQLTVLLAVLFKGDELLGIKSGEDEDIRGIPNQHFTFIFNLVVIMSLFNEINCRKIDGSLNMFAGIHKSFMFIILWSITFTLQVIIIEFGGFAFFTAGLSLEQWMWCIFFGISELLLALLVNVVRQEIKDRMHSAEDSHYINLNKENDMLMTGNHSNIKYTQSNFDDCIIRF